MNLGGITELIFVTLILCIGLMGAAAAAFRVNIYENWDEKRCDPYVLPIAGFFKPFADKRTASQFARDNWSFCQKEYIQRALSTAAEAPKRIAAVAEGSVGIVGSMASAMADVFFDVWKVCYQAYAGFMERMKGVAKLFQNFMMNLYSIVEKLNAAVLSIIYALISYIILVIDSIQLTLIVTIIVIGIILILQILLFFLFMPISSLILTITAVIATVVVTVVTTIAAALVSELFAPGACFVTGTPVILHSGITKPIEEIRVGDRLRDGGLVTAFHEFWSDDPVYDIHGVGVTGDHLIVDCGKLIPVSEHRNAVRRPVSFWSRGQRLWCLTTTTRRIPCNVAATFADWEEIPEEDEDSLVAWYEATWVHLNPGRPIPPPNAAHLDFEGGIAPNTMVACRDWLGRTVYRSISDIRVGDHVCSSETETTVVVGCVVLEGGMDNDSIMLPGVRGRVSAATWILKEGLWAPACTNFPSTDEHPARWYHLYTKSGSFVLEGGWRVRDASEVGLGELKRLVDSIVLVADKSPCSE
jgi:hypothetical protein